MQGFCSNMNELKATKDPYVHVPQLHRS